MHSDEVHCTLKPNVYLAINEFISLKDLAKTSPAMLGLLISEMFAEWEVVVIVCLLRIIVRADLIHPEKHGNGRRLGKKYPCVIDCMGTGLSVIAHHRLTASLAWYCGYIQREF